MIFDEEALAMSAKEQITNTRDKRIESELSHLRELFAAVNLPQ
jgi:hypothetical protein